MSVSESNGLLARVAATDITSNSNYQNSAETSTTCFVSRSSRTARTPTPPAILRIWSNYICQAFSMATLLTLTPFLFYGLWGTTTLLIRHVFTFSWSWIAAFIVSLLVTYFVDRTRQMFRRFQHSLNLAVNLFNGIDEVCRSRSGCSYDKSAAATSTSTLNPPKITVTVGPDMPSTSSTDVKEKPLHCSIGYDSSKYSNPEIQVMRGFAFHDNKDESSQQPVTRVKFADGPLYPSKNRRLHDIQPQVCTSSGTTNFLKQLIEEQF